ncbi:MAG: prolipoprotein diacylglyceryl transferase [Chloroflexi bacterium]|nr:prolipoprotein diacylglyceryl transferase [Chloroflexota bacterium]MBI5290873.1 prolipoprotein diacylglyceryl transferase [Chloroflexota bacterium]
MSIDSLGIHIGTLLYIRFYGIILVTGAVIGTYLASTEARRKGQDPNLVWDALVWALVGGIIGARLYHVFTPPPSMVAAGFTTAAYFADPVKIFQVWNGGLGIPGGIVGGLLAMWLYARYAKVDFLTWVDIAAPAVPLAQAIGRWGNFVNQELYGQPTDLPWAIYIAPLNRVAGFEQFERFHPVFLYESILNLLVCLAMLWLARRFAGRLRSGDMLLLYLMFYPTVRFFMEFLRLDSSGFGNLNINQTLSAAVAVLAGVGFAVRHRRQRRAGLHAAGTPG